MRNRHNYLIPKIGDELEIWWEGSLSVKVVEVRDDGTILIETIGEDEGLAEIDPHTGEWLHYD